jgi:phosphatidylserine/phosphatidylglycerophosphate/cardiolipin synthase-like enzyme
MWYDGVKQADSPGRVLAQGIAGLYQKLKADPSRYPRGLTVRILLGNPPGFGLFPNLNHQVWRVMDDLQAAGIPELRNDEIGWNLEVANFSGAWPHSHTKLMIVDGKVIQVPGYNMQHTHLPKEHPSGKGQGRVDLGMQVTGPAAQTALRAYDDLWQAATHIHCPDLTSGLPIVWMLGCQAKRGVPQHVPEVLRYYVPDESSNAFSIYRSNPFRESDEAYAAALASATSSIDTIHINFSLELVCALNLFIEACNYANRLDYMEALMQAVEKNDVEVRILVSDVAWVGLENNIAIKAFEDELAARGLSDNVEIRYFEQDMHMKSALIDDEFLIVGNQNFHYSAWNSGGLTEFNVGVEAPQAVQDYQRFFNYYWDRAKRRN